VTWVWGILIWVATAVLLGVLIGILLGIRRELEDVGRELNLVLHRAEEIQQELGDIRLQVQAMRGEVAAMLTAMERVGGFK
jgi:hypothetical protein